MSDDVTLDAERAGRLQAALPEVARRTVAAVTAEVPAYADAGRVVDATVEEAVALALGAFLRRLARVDGGAPAAPVLEAAYALGRGEAHTGRTVDALLSAYRVGARVAWRELATVLVDDGVPSAAIARFAELVFAYIDELSAASVAGHGDELATTGRVRQENRDRLALALLAGAPREELVARAARADWEPPATVTAVVLASAHLRAALAAVDGRTLALSGDLAGTPRPDATAVLLVPDTHRGRSAVVAALHGFGAVVGPARPWLETAVSYARALRARELIEGREAAVDTDDHLPALVLGADPEATADLRRLVLAPLADLRPATADRLGETLRSWLLHQGRREAVAADLHVHPQTVRYRMTQVRDLFGDRLTDPAFVLSAILALAADHPRDGC